MAEDNKVTNNEEINYTTNSSENNNETTDAKVTENNTVINEEFIKPKKKILFKVLISIISLLIIIIITGAVLYFTGFFDHKEEVVKEEEQRIEQHVEIVPPPVEKPQVKEDTYRFNIKDINSKKLNDQLASLTTKSNEKKEEKPSSGNVKEPVQQVKNNESELEKEKAELVKQKAELEKQKIEQEKIKEESSTAVKKEDTNNTQELKDVKNETTSDNKMPIKEVKNDENKFLLFISVVKIKGELYKKYLDKITSVDSNVKLCRDEKNQIEIYYGPFKNDEERTVLLNKLIKNKFMEAYELEFTKEEFDKRCNY